MLAGATPPTAAGSAAPFPRPAARAYSCSRARAAPNPGWTCAGRVPSSAEQRKPLSLVRIPRVQVELLRHSGSRRAFALVPPVTLYAQQPPLERRVPGAPFAFALLGSKRGADGSHFGIEIVQIMQQDGFAEHRQLR